MSIKVQPRDILFTFENSCNCCTSCFCKRKNKTNDVIYLNSDGLVERFSSKKCKDPNEYLRRASSNLHTSLEKKAIVLGVDADDLSKKVSLIILEARTYGVYTIEHLEAINSIMLSYFNKKEVQQ